MVRRIFVEKKTGFDIEAKGLLSDLKENLNLSGLSDVRVFNRYDIEGLSESSYEAAKYTIFAEPAIDSAYDEEPPVLTGSVFFGVEYLPGQYDQRADSAVQCIKLMSPESDPIIKFARIIALYGKISKEELEEVKKYCINPVDSKEAEITKPEKLVQENSIPEDVETLKGFIGLSDEEIRSLRRDKGLAMSDEDLIFVREYFKNEEKRNPTVTEIKVIDTYWSDHCRHTTFLTKIGKVTFKDDSYSKMIENAFKDYLNMRKDLYQDRDKDICLMDMAVIGAKYLKKAGKLSDLDESEEINACSIKVKAKIDGKEEDWLVMFKNETHNHPTEIEPFGGAATCLGGAIRDPLSGRVYVYQAMRVTGSGDPRKKLSETIPGKLPQRIITKGAAKGYSSYGNQIGLATGQVAEIYHEGYVAKRMEVGAVIGAAPAENVIRKAPEKGDLIILLGGRTGRDGCGGATGSSKGHDLSSISTCSAEVQKGNPPVERNIQRLFRRKEAATLIKRCNDFGAGGVSVAIGELADGIDVNLDLVPKKYEGLDGTELAISESQERMAVVVDKENASKFLKLAAEENLEAVIVAEVTDKNRFTMNFRGKTILDLSRDFLNTNGVKQNVDIEICEKVFFEEEKDILAYIEKGSELSLMDYVSDLGCCSQKGLTEMFDSTIGAGSVLMPLGGKNQLSPVLGMVAKLPVNQGYTDTATMMSFGFDPEISSISPYHGALYAVIESTTKIAAMGGDVKNIRLTFQEYFERLDKDPKKWAKPFEALLGALRVQKELEIPAIGGKDSMSGSFMDINVPPTLVSFAVCVEDANNIISTDLKEKDSSLVLIKIENDSKGEFPFETYRKNMEVLRQLILAGKVLSANVVGKGGIFVAISKMAVGNEVGVSIDKIDIKELTKRNYGSVIVEISGGDDVSKLFENANYRIVGKTNKTNQISFDTIYENNETKREAFEIQEIIELWEKPLENIFPTKSKAAEKIKAEKIEKISYTSRSNKKPAVKTAKPRIFIPAFPGTNCELDSKKAFDKAGGIATIQILRNLNAASLEESISEMAENIRNSQIIMIPGGFSGGDEPDGSAKFITAVFRNPIIMEEVSDLLNNRDGLILGICNGFQALIKLGLVPYGKIVRTDETSPTLTYNMIGRHASCLVNTRIASVKSPWLAKVNVGDVHTVPVSHGEGRFIASEAELKTLIENGQVATQYVDSNGEPSYDERFNPNGSAMAIEGITSPDGRVFGKMAHSERIGKNLYKNVPGQTDQKIFESGVEYFR